MSTPRFQDALNQIVTAVNNVINAAGITTPCQVGIGWPVATELVKILNNGGCQVTVIDRKGTARSTTRYPCNDLFTITNPVTTLTATVVKPGGLDDPWTIELGGSVGAGATVAAIVGAPSTPALYPCAANESLSTVATGLAEAINALDIAGTSATVSGNNVLVAGSPICVVNVTGTGAVVAQEVNQQSLSVQVDVWAPNPDTRFLFVDAIQIGVGTMLAPFLELSDGTFALCTYAGSASDEQSQSSYSLYAEHMVFAVEYGILLVTPAVEIAVVEATVTINDDPPTTVLSP